MPWICEVCGQMETEGEERQSGEATVDSALTDGIALHSLHVCSTCIQDRQYPSM